MQEQGPWLAFLTFLWKEAPELRKARSVDPTARVVAALHHLFAFREGL